MLKMGDDTLFIRCPTCCEKTFTSRQSLVEHLNEVLANLCCPICNSKSDNLVNLLQHLTLDNCQPQVVGTLAVDSIIENDENLDDSTGTTDRRPSLENFVGMLPDTGNHVKTIDENMDVGKMYIDMLSNQIMKTPEQEVKLIKENSDGQYVIMADDNFKDSNILVTKQNSDGTVSLTMKDTTLETESAIPDSENPEELQELYSCNTCGVSFTSVEEHIQNYHNDQDVLVEEEETTPETPVTYSEAPEEIAETDKPRRVITDTGDIVDLGDEPLMIKAEHLIITENGLVEETREIVESVSLPVKKEVKKARGGGKRYVQIDKFCDSLVKDIKNDKKGPYHKVVEKEMKMLENGTSIKVYNCMVCNLYVKSLDLFTVHPCKKTKYSCPHCTVTYDNSKSLSAHMKVHKLAQAEYEAPETPGPFKCEVCGTVFPSNKSLKLHKRMHDPIKSRPIVPPVEADGGQGSGSEQFLCLVCNKMFPMDYHAVHQRSHQHEERFICDICNRKFHSAEYLDMHLAVHNIDKTTVSKPDKNLPYNCIYCNRQFMRPHEKVKHERIHTGEKPHSCEICGKSFRVSYCLTLHMRTHTGARPYACKHCGKRFKAHSVYNHHLLTHSEVRAYKCPYCPKAFKTSVQLAGHKNSHTKPFSCQHCNRPFASLYAVRVHAETHLRQNNLKFSCSLCGASYARTFALRDHVRQAHADHRPDTADTKEDWMDSAVEGSQLTKDLTTEITELEMANNDAESLAI